MVLALPNHDFLLAAMVLCLDLSVKSRLSATHPSLAWDHDQLDRELEALKTSQQVWTAHDSVTHETHIASLAIDVMVRRVTAARAGSDAVTEKPPALLPHQGNHALLTSVAFPGGNMFAADPLMTVQAEEHFPTQLPWAHSMESMIDGTEGIDWGSLDQYFLLGVDEFNAEYAT